jgi:hypothetical protein
MDGEGNSGVFQVGSVVGIGIGVAYCIGQPPSGI